MKTNLPTSITTVEEAKAFLTELHTNGEAFHPEDDATDIEWNMADLDKPNFLECEHLNKLTCEIYNLPEVANYPDETAFDPCAFLAYL